MRVALILTNKIVDVLKKYADYSWSLDPHIFFEHLGGNTEEQQWANYMLNLQVRIMWGKMTDNYNELSMGYPANISGMTSASRGFTANRLMGYAESHDEERLMYKTCNNTNTYNVKNLDVASRMSAIEAVFFVVWTKK
jgi:hypothetical protein